MAEMDEQAPGTVAHENGSGGTPGESVHGDSFNLTDLMARLPQRSVPISALTPGYYLRQAGTNAVHVQLLAGVSATADLPPILVQERGWRIIDGMHRLEAARLCGESAVTVCFIDCSDEEALVLAIKANTLHGLPLSKSDRLAGARRVLAAHTDWSDRAVAEITGLSGKTIASLRNRSTEGARAGVKRLGRDGKRRPVNAGEGRRRAADYIQAHPDAPLRQVAREADVSLGTVHDVSARIRRGTAPERPQPVRLTQQARELPPGPRLASPVNGMPRQRARPGAVPPAWPVISAKLANDPAIRYTEGGKEFLRWMAQRAPHADEWRELIDAIPVHWLSVIASVAEGVSDEWSQFADGLRSKQEAAS